MALMTGAHLPSSLAWTELRLAFAHVFRKFDMGLKEPM